MVVWWYGGMVVWWYGGRSHTHYCITPVPILGAGALMLNAWDWTVTICELEYSRKDLLIRHMKTAHTTKQFQCELCEFTCSRKDSLKRHIDSHTKTKSQVTKRKATNSASNEKKRTKLYMDDDIFNSDDEDQIFNEAYNFNNQKRNKI